jgi:hypothetical protein
MFADLGDGKKLMDRELLNGIHRFAVVRLRKRNDRVENLAVSPGASSKDSIKPVGKKIN